MWFFVSDLHGRVDRWRTLFEVAARECPSAILLGGDLLPSGLLSSRSVDPRQQDFIADFLAPGFAALRHRPGGTFPRILMILGNDDPRDEERIVLGQAATAGWEYLHARSAVCDGVRVFGYACVPPTPFLLKDWERYDVSRFVDPGCVSPEEGWRSMPAPPNEVRYGTIKEDLDRLAGDEPMDASVWLFHAPPHGTALDRAALDGVLVDHAPLDVHVGSVAVRRFIDARQPLVTLHGHIHESTRLTGEWRQQIGRTWAFSAAHDGPELALVRFDPRNPAGATRELIRAPGRPGA